MPHSHACAQVKPLLDAIGQGILDVGDEARSGSAMKLVSLSRQVIVASISQQILAEREALLQHFALTILCTANHGSRCGVQFDGVSSCLAVLMQLYLTSSARFPCIAGGQLLHQQVGTVFAPPT